MERSIIRDKKVRIAAAVSLTFSAAFYGCSDSGRHSGAVQGVSASPNAELRASSDILLQDQSGNKLDLSQYLGHEPAALFFWDTGCSPCDDVISQVSHVKSKYESQGLFVAPIALNGVSQLASEISPAYTFDHALDKYSLQGVPTMILLDRDGIQVQRLEGSREFSDLDSKIENLIRNE